MLIMLGDQVLANWHGNGLLGRTAVVCSLWSASNILLNDVNILSYNFAPSV